MTKCSCLLISAFRLKEQKTTIKKTDGTQLPSHPGQNMMAETCLMNNIYIRVIVVMLHICHQLALLALSFDGMEKTAVGGWRKPGRPLAVCRNTTIQFAQG